MSISLKTKLSWVLLFCLLGFTACGEEKESTETPPSGENLAIDPKEEAPKRLPFDPGAIYLERMYATSVGEGDPKFLLDGNESTQWVARKGAGPDEGIMLYFEDPTQVASIRVKSGPGENPIQLLQCFVNGSDAGKVKLDENKKIDAEVQSLFLRIVEVAGGNVIEREYEDETTRLVKYPEDLQVALGEIEFLNEEGEVMQVRSLAQPLGRIEATSVLSPAEAYNTDFLFDSNLEFGWAEGVESEGIGEKLTFNFDQIVRIEKLKIWNGYQRSESHFERNVRAKSISFGLQGEPAKDYELRDERGGQEVDLGMALEGKSFEFEIKDVFPGKSYQDLVLSELRFFDGQRWFGLECDGMESRRKALNEKTKGTVLEPLLDHNLNYSFYSEINEEGLDIRLILRSNGSFVLYRDVSEPYFQTETVKSRVTREVADGNWSVEDMGDGYAQIKIFGKLRRIMEREMWYKSAEKSDRTRIFSEILTIIPELIEGQKLIDAMPLDLSPAEDMGEIQGSLDPNFGAGWNADFPEQFFDRQIGLEV